LRNKKLLDKKDNLTERAVELAALVMYIDELDKISPKGIGDRDYKKPSSHGDKYELKNYHKGERYRDISVRKSIRTALRRNRNRIETEDLRVFRRIAKGEIFVVFALDSSGSMKGDKIGSCKKAGIALAYKAIEKKDRVGLIVFGPGVKKTILPTNDFTELIKEIAAIRAASSTDIAGTIDKAVDMYPKTNVTKHLVLLTDGMPTTGKEPKKNAIEAASKARASGITISVVGIQLDKGRKLAEKIAEIGEGRLFLAKDTKDIDSIVLEDYTLISQN